MPTVSPSDATPELHLVTSESESCDGQVRLDEPKEFYLGADFKSGKAEFHIEVICESRAGMSEWESYEGPWEIGPVFEGYTASRHGDESSASIAGREGRVMSWGERDDEVGGQHRYAGHVLVGDKLVVIQGSVTPASSFSPRVEKYMHKVFKGRMKFTLQSTPSSA